MDSSAKNAPACRCGHHTNHPSVDAKPSYGFWAWLALLNGISGKPKQITWRCRDCGETIRQTKNPRELNAFR